MSTFCRAILVAACLFLFTSAAQAEEIKQYPHNTNLLIRKFDKTVKLVPSRPSALAAGFPSRFDWGPLAQNPLGRDLTSPVRTQGDCGACWAFASVACLEAWINAKFRTSVDLSEEMLISDCCAAGDCFGGFIDKASDWLVGIGTTTEQCWPFSGTNCACADYCSDPQIGRINSWDYASGNWWTIDIGALKTALVEHGPLVAGMEVYADFYNYSGGAYRRSYGTYQGGHAILITGFVDNPKVPGGGYFIAKNSWGSSFGPYGGYFAVAYDSNCNFGVEATYYTGVTITNELPLKEEP